jgi:hypothetical protein
MPKNRGALVAGLLALFPQTAFAGDIPSRLSGVIIFSCITTDAGAKVDEEIYIIDFSKKRVNDQPADLQVTGSEIIWRKLDKPTHGSIDLSGRSINRYSGKLDDGFRWNGSKRLTVCHVADRRKF